MLDLLKNNLTQYLGGDVGFNPQQLALMRTQALNQISKSYGGAKSNLAATMQARGMTGGNLPSGGDAVRGFEGLESAAADTRSSQLANIDLSNLSQALQNKWQALGMLQGQAGLQTPNISSFGSGANNALNTYSDSLTHGFGGQFMSNLGSSLGKSIGESVGKGAQMGLGNLMGG